MSHIRSQIQKKAKSYILQNAFLRWENAVVLAGTIILTGLWSLPFPQWPSWGWPLLGLMGIVALIYSSLTDVKNNTRILLGRFQEQFNSNKIKDNGLRDKVDIALEYLRRIEIQLQNQPQGILRNRLEDTADQLTDWIDTIYKLVLKLDEYNRDEFLSHGREKLPKEIEKLSAQRKREINPTVQKRLEGLLESKDNQWKTLQALDNRMKQAELQLEQSTSALATVYHQMQLIDTRDANSSRSGRLESDIQEQINNLNDLIASINEISLPQQSYKNG
jgi:hypothetical protein